MSISAGRRAVDNWASSAGIAHRMLVVKRVNVCFRKPFRKKRTKNMPNQIGNMNLVAEVSTTSPASRNTASRFFSISLRMSNGTKAKSPTSKESVQLTIIQRKTVEEFNNTTIIPRPTIDLLNFLAIQRIDNSKNSSEIDGIANIPGIPKIATKGTESNGYKIL